MSGYIGRQPVTKASRYRQAFILQAGEDTIYFPYVPGMVDLYLIGHLMPETDYVATNGASIKLNDPVADTTEIECVSYSTFESADHYRKADTYNKTEVQGLLGYRNKIVNGDFESWQEGTSFTGISLEVPVADVFIANVSASTSAEASVNRVDGPFAKSNAARFEITSAEDLSGISDAWVMFETKLELGSVRSMVFGASNEYITFSKKIRTNFPGTYTVVFAGENTNTGTGNNRIVLGKEITLIGAGDWEEVVITVPKNTAHGWLASAGTSDLGLRVLLVLDVTPNRVALYDGEWMPPSEGRSGTMVSNPQKFAATVGNYIETTDWQLEEGDTATPFERLPPGEQLRRCQRYLQTYIPAPSSDDYLCLLQAYNASAAYGPLRTDGLRATPNVSISGSFTLVGDLSSITVSPLTASYIRPYVIRLKADGAITQGASYELRANPGSSIIIDARF